MVQKKSEQFGPFGKIVVTSWRLLNAIALATGFAGPWFAILGDLANGFLVTRFMVTTYVGSGIQVFVDLFVKPGYFWLNLSDFLIVAGLISSCIYCGVNLLGIMIKRKWSAIWLVVPLIGGIVGLLALTVFLAEYAYGGLNRCCWGYWLVLGSLGSSALLEIVDIYRLRNS